MTADPSDPSAPSSQPVDAPLVRDPGPSLDLTSSEPLLRRLELTVRNRLDGLLQGNYVGLLPGPGSETGESRQYTPGDDVRRMDWPVTARTTVPHVRQTIADRELETWLVADLSPSMDFGTALSEKRELVLAAVTAVVHLTARGGNRVGALVSDGHRLQRIPALPGRDHARHLVRRVAATDRGGPGGTVTLAAMLESLRRPPRRRGLVAVISDFVDPAAAAGGPATWERPLQALRERHQLLAIEVLDPRELELQPAGLVTFVDPETGRQVEVQTSSAKVRAAYAEAAAGQRARVDAALRHAGASVLRLRTNRDWVEDVVRFVLSARRRPGDAAAAEAARGGGAPIGGVR